LNKNSLKTLKIPKKVLDGQDNVKDFAVGGSFAFCFT
jgi:hypothetical protein